MKSSTALPEPAPTMAPEALGHGALASAPVGIVVYDRELRCVLWKPQMEKLTGHPAEHMLGSDTLPAMPAALGRLLGRALTGESVGQGNARYAPYRDANGRVVGVVGCIQEPRDA